MPLTAEAVDSEANNTNIAPKFWVGCEDFFSHTQQWNP